MRIWHQSFTDLDRVPLYRQTLIEHARRVADPGMEVRIHGLRPGTYRDGLTPVDAIRHPYLEFLGQNQICEAALVAEREGYDVVALGCFYDPGLRQARSLVDIPIVGLSETCMLVACSLGRKFSLIALNRDQLVQHNELAEIYGLGSRLANVVAMEPGINEYVLEADDRATEPILEGFRYACRQALEGGAEVIIPGDGVLNEFLYRRSLLEVEGTPIMDALGVLFRYAVFMADAREKIGLTTSRRLHYAKPSSAMLDHARAASGLQPWQEDDFSGAPSAARSD
jgi:allantoin racemase